MLAYCEYMVVGFCEVSVSHRLHSFKAGSNAIIQGATKGFLSGIPAV